MAAYPFIRVDVIDHVQTFFWGLLSGGTTQNVRAFAVCGALLLKSATPILVLDPQNNGSTAALTVSGNPQITVYGGPSKSIQINSSNTAALSIGGTAKIILSQGGPNLTGSDIGVAGGPVAAPAGVTFGTTGSWTYPSAAMSDPFATLCAPGQSGCPQVNGVSAPAVPGVATVPADEAAKGCKTIPCTIAYHDAGHGCPASGGCVLYTAGYYASGITVASNKIAVFDPGLYYMVNNLTLNSNSTVRPSTGTGDGSGGTIFYFSGAHTISVNASAGKIDHRYVHRQLLEVHQHLYPAGQSARDNGNSRQRLDGAVHRVLRRPAWFERSARYSARNAFFSGSLRKRCQCDLGRRRPIRGRRQHVFPSL